MRHACVSWSEQLSCVACYVQEPRSRCPAKKGVCPNIRDCAPYLINLFEATPLRIFKSVLGVWGQKPAPASGETGIRTSLVLGSEDLCNLEMLSRAPAEASQSAHVCLCACVFMCMYVCMHVCMRVCIRIGGCTCALYLICTTIYHTDYSNSWVCDTMLFATQSRTSVFVVDLFQIKHTP